MIKFNIRINVCTFYRANGNKPIVVVDLFNFGVGTAIKFRDDFVYGGRHRQMQKYFKSILIKFRETGCKLVFFSDYNVQDDKKTEWLDRKNEQFRYTTELYKWIGSGKTRKEMADMPKQWKLALKVAVYVNALIAKDFGEIHYAVDHECDFEIARYAKQHGAMAIVSSDTDFLIFDGSWKLWSTSDMRFNHANQLITKEFKADAIQRTCKLEQNQLPLFATIVGNDFTKNTYKNELNVFHCKLGAKEKRVENVAKYVREMDWTKSVNHHINTIMETIFNDDSHKMRKFIKRSLNFYKIDTTIVLDLNEDVPNYPPIMSRTQAVNLIYYDMYACGEVLPMLLFDWMKRRIGLSWRQNNKQFPTFTLLVKKNLNEDYMDYAEKPIYPEHCKFY